MQNLPITYKYILSPNLEVINKDAKQYEDTEEKLDVLGYLETKDFISLKINYFAKVILTQKILSDSEIDLIYTFEFQIHSPFDSMKNAINQITDFMKKNFPENATWEIDEIKRVSHLN